MEKNGLFYFMVNVLGQYGYSFMVTTQNENISDRAIIKQCSQKELFQDETDRDYAVVDDFVTEYDINAMSNHTYNID